VFCAEPLLVGLRPDHRPAGRTPATIELMHQQATTGREQLWDLDFPGQIPDTTVHATPVPPATASG
jgi:hypothetical protein